MRDLNKGYQFVQFPNLLGQEVVAFYTNYSAFLKSGEQGYPLVEMYTNQHVALSLRSTHPSLSLMR